MLCTAIEQLREEQSFLAAVMGTEETIKIPAAEGEKCAVWSKNNNQAQRTSEEVYCFLVPNKLMFLKVNCSQYDQAISIVLDTVVPSSPMSIPCLEKGPVLKTLGPMWQSSHIRSTHNSFGYLFPKNRRITIPLNRVFYFQLRNKQFSLDRDIKFLSTYHDVIFQL